MEELRGKDIDDYKGAKRQQVQGPRIQPLSLVRQAASLLPEIRHVQDMSQKAGFERADPRGNQIKLVTAKERIEEYYRCR